MQDLAASTKDFPTVQMVNSKLLELDPSQEKFLTRRFSHLEDAERKHLETIAKKCVALAGDQLNNCVEDYLWWCRGQMEEELYFRRHKTYRRTTLEECVRDVYSDSAYMTRYMNGLLFTQIWWSNHTRTFAHYLDAFISHIPKGARHLEIGPGHGLLLYFACENPNISAIETWDISKASLVLSEEGLRHMGVKNMPQFVETDMMASSDKTFDSIVFSEVLEHMEAPSKALKVLQDLLSDDGRLYLHMPINSPAPDHLFNLPKPEDLSEFLTNAGFEILDENFAPATNYDLDTAIRKQLTISCAYILKKA